MISERREELAGQREEIAEERPEVAPPPGLREKLLYCTAGVAGMSFAVAVIWVFSLVGPGLARLPQRFT